MGLCTNTFTLVHSSFEKSMENLLSPGLSCSAPNFVSAKFRNGVKIIKLQNQYLIKKCCPQVKQYYVDLRANVHITDVSRGTNEHKITYFLPDITPILLLSFTLLCNNENIRKRKNDRRF